MQLVLYDPELHPLDLVFPSSLVYSIWIPGLVYPHLFILILVDLPLRGVKSHLQSMLGVHLEVVYPSLHP